MTANRSAPAWNSKTDADGKTSYDGVPYGKLRIQVLAHGFQTYGEDYDINQPDMDITIKMKRPAGQYSIYEDHPAENKNKKPDGREEAAVSAKSEGDFEVGIE